MVEAAFIFDRVKNIMVRLVFITFVDKIERNTLAAKNAWYLKHNAIFRLRIAKHVPF